MARYLPEETRGEPDHLSDRIPITTISPMHHTPEMRQAPGVGKIGRNEALRFPQDQVPIRRDSLSRE